MSDVVSRRSWLARTVLAGAAVAVPLQAATKRARVVVVGGGFGGATAARQIKQLLPGTHVTLVERKTHYWACPFSNLVIAGERDMSQQRFTYAALSSEGIHVVRDRAVDVDVRRRVVKLAHGDDLTFDRLVLSPGIDFRWEALDGYDQTVVDALPHAWQAGPQTTLLRRQIESMNDDGVVVISVPAAPFRCPPGPYERASLVAHYLKQHKPRAKVIILDSNRRFSKQPLFEQAWRSLYGDMIEWRAPDKDGRVVRVDAKSKTLHTDFTRQQGDVVNVIPPQRAGEIAVRAGVADGTGWCPVDPVSFESRQVAGVHVIGDAMLAAPMPKSAFSANLQGRVCAIQIARMLSGLEPQPTVLANTCYSLVSDDRAISISGVYHNRENAFTSVAGAGGMSPLDAPDGLRQYEARQARDWFSVLTRSTFG